MHVCTTEAPRFLHGDAVPRSREPAVTARPCLDCGVLVRVGSRCEPCTAALPARVRPARPSRPKAWRRLSLQARELQPFCEDCGTTQDLSADHLVPVSLGGRMLPALDGLGVVCRPCNAKRYAAQRRALQEVAEHPGPTSQAIPARSPGAELTRRGRAS